MQFPKWVVVSGIVVGVVAGGVTGVYIWQKTVSKKSEAPQVTSVSAPAAVEMATWTDPAGFTFQYPKELTVDKHDEDTENYAHVELTHKDHPGNLIVWVKDTKAADVNAWVKTEKLFAGATVSEATLGGKPAKNVSRESPKKMMTGTISDELLFVIETAPTDAAYWTGVHDSIVKSFAFVPLDQTSANPDTSATNDWTEEEVVE